MGALGALPSLPSLGSVGNSGAGASGATAGTPAATASAPSGPEWLTGELAQIVTILLGLILIVAGLFSFHTVREVTVRGAELAATA